MQINTSSIERDYLGEGEGRGNGRRWGRERKGTWNESKKRIESKRHKRIKGVPRKLRSINKCVSFSPHLFFLFFLFSPIRHAIFMLVQNKILITNGRSSVAIRSRPVHAPFDSFAFPSRIFFSHNFFAVEEKLELQPRVNLAQPRIRSFFFSSPLSKMDSNAKETLSFFISFPISSTLSSCFLFFITLLFPYEFLYSEL